jgi:hypothetical protein
MMIPTSPASSPSRLARIEGSANFSSNSVSISGLTREFELTARLLPYETPLHPISERIARNA